VNERRSPSPLKIVSTGAIPSSGVRPCWSTVMSTDHLSPGAVPAGRELRPTVAQPPADAAGTATAASARTSRSFFIRDLRSG
jgi:hypothetical protein